MPDQRAADVRLRSRRATARRRRPVAEQARSASPAPAQSRSLLFHVEDQHRISGVVRLFRERRGEFDLIRCDSVGGTARAELPLARRPGRRRGFLRRRLPRALSASDEVLQPALRASWRRWRITESFGLSQHGRFRSASRWGRRRRCPAASRISAHARRGCSSRCI